jgi:hypothetical protein
MDRVKLQLEPELLERKDLRIDEGLGDDRVTGEKVSQTHAKAGFAISAARFKQQPWAGRRRARSSALPPSARAG